MNDQTQPFQLGDHAIWMRLARIEYQRLSALIGSFQDDDWSRPTDCAGWDVRAMVSHLTGAAKSNASILEASRQMATAALRSRTDKVPLVDALSGLQIQEHAHLDPRDLAKQFQLTWTGALRGRTRMPALLRTAVRVPVATPGLKSTWSLGYLNDCIYTRDCWMHRIDLSRAVDRDFEVTAGHDGVIVADIVAEWANRHGRPYQLILTGPAGGTFGAGSGGPVLELDAIEFARIVSGRTPGTGLLATPVPF